MPPTTRVHIERYELDDELLERIATYFAHTQDWRIRGKRATREQVKAFIDEAWESKWIDVMDTEQLAADAETRLLEELGIEEDP